MKALCKWSIAILTIVFLGFSACKKDNSSGGNNNNQNHDTLVKPRPVLEDTIARHWIVTKSTHNGDPDPGTVGLEMNFNSDGTYKLVNTGYDGTWEFLENKTKILMDKNDPSWKTTWTIQKLTSKSFIVTFISPFSGGNVYWEMEPN